MSPMRRKNHPADPTDELWDLVRPLLPKAEPGGRQPSVDLREVLYAVRGGVHLRTLPNDLPPWGAVQYCYRRRRLDGTRDRIMEALRARLRHADGRKKSPSAAIVDSRTVRTAEGGVQVYDAGKRALVRKRAMVIDTLGLIPAVVVRSASVEDRDAVKLVLPRLKGRTPRLRPIRADSDYEAAVGRAREFAGRLLEMVRKPEDRKGFVVPPRRWAVERTFGRLTSGRRPADE
ncbi:IS5 family transposase [Paludisphaera soli]|uniref:IS5 family transposase n=1 Tax=Paludisphaera soli TaxID=2712865 RepID=UPI0013EC0CA4|nr:IS5 family transposase [Paludisphaera soli]